MKTVKHELPIIRQATVSGPSVFLTPDLRFLEESALAQFVTEENITLLIDARSPAEIATFGTPLDLADQLAYVPLFLQSPQWPSDLMSLLTEDALTEWAPAFLSMLANNTGGTLIVGHTGIDRVGLIGWILETLAGVSDEDRADNWADALHGIPEIATQVVNDSFVTEFMPHLDGRVRAIMHESEQHELVTFSIAMSADKMIGGKAGLSQRLFDAGIPQETIDLLGERLSAPSEQTVR